VQQDPQNGNLPQLTSDSDCTDLKSLAFGFIDNQVSLKQDVETLAGVVSAAIQKSW